MNTIKEPRYHVGEQLPYILQDGVWREGLVKMVIRKVQYSYDVEHPLGRVIVPGESYTDAEKNDDAEFS